MSAAIRSGSYKDIFESKETIASLIECVVVPNIVLRGIVFLLKFGSGSNFLIPQTFQNTK